MSINQLGQEELTLATKQEQLAVLNQQEQDLFKKVNENLDKNRYDVGRNDKEYLDHLATVDNNFKRLLSKIEISVITKERRSGMVPGDTDFIAPADIQTLVQGKTAEQSISITGYTDRETVFKDNARQYLTTYQSLYNRIPSNFQSYLSFPNPSSFNIDQGYNGASNNKSEYGNEILVQVRVAKGLLALIESNPTITPQEINTHRERQAPDGFTGVGVGLEEKMKRPDPYIEQKVENFPFSNMEVSNSTLGMTQTFKDTIIPKLSNQISTAIGTESTDLIDASFNVNVANLLKDNKSFLSRDDFNQQLDQIFNTTALTGFKFLSTAINFEKGTMVLVKDGVETEIRSPLVKSEFMVKDTQGNYQLTIAGIRSLLEDTQKRKINNPEQQNVLGQSQKSILDNLSNIQNTVTSLEQRKYTITNNIYGKTYAAYDSNTTVRHSYKIEDNGSVVEAK